MNPQSLEGQRQLPDRFEGLRGLAEQGTMQFGQLELQMFDLRLCSSGGRSLGCGVMLDEEVLEPLHVLRQCVDVQRACGQFALLIYIEYVIAGHYSTRSREFRYR